MGIAALLEIAIGLAFVWIGLSLCTVVIQPWISTRLRIQTTYLQNAIEYMLRNPNLRAQLYDHPLLRAVPPKKARPISVPAWSYRYPLVRGFTRTKRIIPQSISSEQFALSLFDILLTAGTESSLIQQGFLKIRDDLEKERKLSSRQQLIEELNILIEFARSAAATEAGTAFTKRTLPVLKKKAEEFSLKYPELRPPIDAALEEASKRKDEIDDLLKNEEVPRASDAFNSLKRGITALSVISPELHHILVALLQNLEEYVTAGETPLSLAQKKVEKWFNDSMEGLKADLIRRSQMLSLAIGFVFALILNIDSINLATFLWRDAAVRQILVENARDIQQFQKQFAQPNLPVGWIIAETGGPALRDKNCQLLPWGEQKFGVPVFNSNMCIVSPPLDNNTNFVIKFLGILVTAAAAYQGAPFWFNLLKSLITDRII